MKIKIYLSLLVTIIVTQISSYSLIAQTYPIQDSYENVYEKIESLFNKADIPGLSLILVDEKNTYIKTWGFADIENKIPVTSKTLFELGSTSKAFTALAILKMEKEGIINLDDYVSKYIHWFKVFYEGKEVQVTIKELLHHTSGIPTETISKIPQGEADDMLEKTVRTIDNLELKRFPGKEFEYATINYDILGLIIEKVSHFSFEAYLQKNIFQALELEYTSVGTPKNDNLAKGYKISYFSPREYQPPRYRGNNPAGYVISNADDMAKWLKYQMGIDTNCFEEIIRKSHAPDLSVVPNGLSSYASGWQVNPYGESKIYHGGLNPNFSSFVGFLPDKKIGFAILANSNSSYTSYLGNILLRTINGEDISEIAIPVNVYDRVFSLASYIFFVFIVGIIIILFWIIGGLIKRKREIAIPKPSILFKIIGGLVLAIPFIIGIYFLPDALMSFSWDAAIIWAPESYVVCCILFVCSVFGIWILNIISEVTPTKNKYFRSLPIILIISILSGLANMTIILLLINAVGAENKFWYIVYYFILALTFYITSRKIIQTKLIKISESIIFDVRMKLIRKIFLSTFQNFEKIDNGRVFATLNNDTEMISGSVDIAIRLISSIVTIVGVFIYLGTISMMITLILFLVILSVAILFHLTGKKTQILFEQSRDASNIFADLIDGLLYGFKELSLSGLKKEEYTKDVENSCLELKDKNSLASIKYINANLIGESLLIITLSVISFVIPIIFTDIPNYKLITFIMITLYMIGPIKALLQGIPSVLRIKVSWNRINSFIDEINPDMKEVDISLNNKNKSIINSLSVQGLKYVYKNKLDDNKFEIGPIDFTINRGEVLFVIGGNGSGKSTLANLLTGLYTADEGFIKINGVKISSSELSHMYSAIFSENHLFQKLYGIKTDEKKEELKNLLELLRLQDKVNVKDNKFSTIKLSNGQRKRLTLLKVFIENSQIYLFDEWAADQDPEYKKIFYRELLLKMKNQGKIVIAITHDDNYFDVADKIIKMNNGQIAEFINQNPLNVESCNY